MSTEHLLRRDESAYRTCSCRYCSEIAIGTAGAICGDCEEAGCTPGECEREDEIFDGYFGAEEAVAPPAREAAP